MLDLSLLLAGAVAIVVGLVVLAYGAGRSDNWIKVRAEGLEGLNYNVGCLGDQVTGLCEKFAGVRQETERAVAHIQHKHDEEIIHAETERNKMIEEFQWAMGEGLLGADSMRMSRAMSHEKRPVPERRPLGSAIGGSSDKPRSRGGSLTGRGLADVFVEEPKKPGGDKADG